MQQTILTKRPDVVLIQESHRSINELIPAELPGYNVYERARTQPVTESNSETRGGGLLTFVHSSRTVLCRAEMNFGEDTTTEGISITLRRELLPPLTIHNVYRAPVGGGNDVRPREFNTEALPSEEFDVICGDINAHHPKWSERTRCPNGKRLHDWLGPNSMKSNLKPWQHTMVAFKSSPDVVITSTSVTPLRCEPLEESWGSDHRPILIELPASFPSTKRSLWRVKWDWAKMQRDKFERMLEEACKQLSSTQNYDELAKKLALVIRKAADESIPKKRIFQGSLPWWTEELSKLKKAKDELASALTTNKTRDTQDEFNKAEKAFKRGAILAKTKHWNKYVAELNSRKAVSQVFQKIAHLDGRRNRKELPVIVINGRTYRTERDKAAALGKYLADTCTNSRPTEKWKPQQGPVVKDFAGSLDPFTEQELERAIRKLRPSKSHDPEGLCAIFVKSLTPSAKEQLLRLMNYSWEHSFIPDDWRSAQLTMILKPFKEDTTRADAYRYISLTSVLAKLTETVIKDRLTHLVELTKYPTKSFAEEQAAYRPGRGTEEQVAAIAMKIEELLGRRKHTSLLLFDLEKAFDKVDLGLLLRKLEARGIPAKYLSWIHEFLSKRRAAVKVGDVLGPYFTLKTGLPQGTVLGPFLFLVFIDDLADMLKRKGVTFSLFADDLAVVTSGDSLLELKTETQEVVDIVDLWTKESHMAISESKTKYMYFHPPDQKGAMSNHTLPTGFLVYPSTKKLADFVTADPQDIDTHFEENSMFLKQRDARGNRRLVVGCGRPGNMQKVYDKQGVLKHSQQHKTTLAHAVPIPQAHKAFLLGVQFDDLLTFEPHVEYALNKVSMRLRILRKLAGTEWGYSTEKLRTVYLLYVLPVFAYCFCVYGHHLSETSLTSLETLHTRALSYISGCPSTTDPYLLQLETRTPSLQTLLDVRTTSLYEKLMRRKGWPSKFLNNPRSPFGIPVGKLQRRCHTLKYTAELGTDVKRENFTINWFPPWSPDPIEHVQFNTSVGFKKSEDTELNHRRAVEALSKLPVADVEIFTDGSKVLHKVPKKGEQPDLPIASYGWGGAAYTAQLSEGFATLADAQGLKKRTSYRDFSTTYDQAEDCYNGVTAAGTRVTSYRAEQVAILGAVQWAVNVLKNAPPPLSLTQAGTEPGPASQQLTPVPSPNQKTHYQINIITDCQGLLVTLARGSHVQRDPANIMIWEGVRRLAARECKIVFQHIHSHCGIPGNMRADVLAREGADRKAPYITSRICAAGWAKEVQRLQWHKVGTSNVTCRRVKQNLHPYIHPYFSMNPGRCIPKLQGLTRKAETEIKRVRTGHHALFRTYLNRCPDYIKERHTVSEGVTRTTRIMLCPLCKAQDIECEATLFHVFCLCPNPNSLYHRSILEEKSKLKRRPDITIDFKFLRNILFIQPALALEFLQNLDLIEKFTIVAPDQPDTEELCRKAESMDPPDVDLDFDHGIDPTEELEQEQAQDSFMSDFSEFDVDAALRDLGIVLSQLPDLDLPD